MEPGERFEVTVAYALPERQDVVSLQMEPGSTAGTAVERSGLLQRYPAISEQPLKFAIFGRIVLADAVLAAGDRVEILRPLPNDPKDTRRKLAARGQTMGRGRTP